MFRKKRSKRVFRVLTVQPDFMIGDIFISRRPGLVSRLVSMLVSIRYGIPWREAYSHIELKYQGRDNISAEMSGVKTVKTDRYAEGSRLIVYRLSRMSASKRDQLVRVAQEYIGKPYAFWRYFLDATIISVAVLVLFGLLAAIPAYIFSFESGQHAVVFNLLAVGFLLVVKQRFVKKDRLTYDCAELVSVLLSEIGLWSPLPTSRNEFPNGMKQVLDNLCRVNQAQIVYRKD